MRELAIIAKNTNTKLDELWEAVFKGVTASLVHLKGVVAVQMIYRTNDSYKGTAVVSAVFMSVVMTHIKVLLLL